eukprot:1678528-Rhodomonas_salina.3
MVQRCVTEDLRFRSMEAHNQMLKQGLCVRSFGTGTDRASAWFAVTGTTVRLPGPSEVRTMITVMTVMIKGEGDGSCKAQKSVMNGEGLREGGYEAVSYTHLTLPTICSV